MFLKQTLMTYGIDEKKIFVQPNAIDIDEIQGVKPYIFPESINRKFRDKTIIGFLGRLLPWYKLPELINAYYHINNNYPNTLLIMIGDGSQRPQLESMTEALGLKENIHFFGQVGHSEALSLLKLMDIAVVPSTNMWGFTHETF